MRMTDAFGLWFWLFVDWSGFWLLMVRQRRGGTGRRVRGNLGRVGSVIGIKSVASKHPAEPADTDPLVASDCDLDFFDFLGLSSFPERIEIEALDLCEGSGRALKVWGVEGIVLLLPGGLKELV